VYVALGIGFTDSCNSIKFNTKTKITK